jgi:hypothetical protein
MELAHVIVSMMDSRPVKVLCKTCKTQHNYRRAGEAPTRRASASSGTAAKPKRVSAASPARATELWESKMSKQALSAIRPYQPVVVFAKNDVMQHSKFGVGFVEEMKGNKIVVLFQDGEKTLVHSMVAASVA